MDILTDCPVCFETYCDEAACERWTTPCCAQDLCQNCSEALRLCPFCRHLLHGEDPQGVAADGNPWLRRSFPNPIFLVAGLSVLPDILASPSVRAVASSAAAAATTLTEASPVVLGGAMAGSVVLAGGVGVFFASQHSEEHAQRLQEAIRDRGSHSRRSSVPWKVAAGTLLEAVQWHLLPQKPGFPHVYHGSVWRSQARERYLQRVRSNLDLEPSPEAEPPLREKLWGDLSFCFALWLDYNPHTANWGTSTTYGSPPMHFCWHNRWREDLRHALSDLSQYVVGVVRPTGLRDGSLDETECACAICLLGALDHILSWDVSTPTFGHSELITAEWHLYNNFCENMTERIACAWGAALAPPDAEVDLASFEEHVVQIVASRQDLEGFRDVWHPASTV